MLFFFVQRLSATLENFFARRCFFAIGVHELGTNRGKTLKHERQALVPAELYESF